MLYKNNRIKLAIKVLLDTVREQEGQVVFEGEATNFKMKGKIYTFFFSNKKQQLREQLHLSEIMLVEGYFTNSIGETYENINTKLYIKVEQLDVCKESYRNLNKFDYTFQLEGVKPSGQNFMEILHIPVIPSLSDKQLRVVCHNSIFHKVFKKPEKGQVYNIKSLMMADVKGQKDKVRDTVLIQSATLLATIKLTYEESRIGKWH